MSNRQTALEIRGLGKERMAAVIARAKRLGMTPQRYLKHLVEEDLAISNRAKETSFENLLGSGHDADEREIDQLVEAARSSYREHKTRKG
jgi:ABC-type uncharacterized transport system ATPase subunit